MANRRAMLLTSVGIVLMAGACAIFLVIERRRACELARVAHDERAQLEATRAEIAADPFLALRMRGASSILDRERELTQTAKRLGLGLYKWLAPEPGTPPPCEPPSASEDAGALLERIAVLRSGTQRSLEAARASLPELKKFWEDDRTLYCGLVASLQRLGEVRTAHESRCQADPKRFGRACLPGALARIDSEIARKDETRGINERKLKAKWDATLHERIRCD